MPWTKEAVEASMNELKLLEAEVARLDRELKDKKAQAGLLKDRIRVNCQHEFTPAQGVWAHEGGRCKHCDIGELHAPNHRVTHQRLIED